MTASGGGDLALVLDFAADICERAGDWRVPIALVLKKVAQPGTLTSLRRVREFANGDADAARSDDAARSASTPRVPAMGQASERLRCSFCNESQTADNKLIAGTCGPLRRMRHRQRRAPFDIG